jgi:hypothetical protein
VYYYLAVSFDSADRVYFDSLADFSSHVLTSFSQSASSRWAKPGFCLPGAPSRHRG